MRAPVTAPAGAPQSAPTPAPNERVRVKICGITSAADAVLAAELGADYLGLNFYHASPRCLTAARAREIAAAVRGAVPRVELVGVFVNQPAAEVEELALGAGLDLLQFSGDEGPERLRPVAARAIKAFRSAGPPAAAELAAFGGLFGVLVDAAHRTLYGGTGLAWDYGSLARAASTAGRSLALGGRRLFLAGGLGPDNIRRAVAAVRPFAVDVCSAVESTPGSKDRELLRRLFQEVRHDEA
ncbi:MAG TPA: phosphoribosylanthranilate isomerase [Thermoanaerobaculia bacterium]|nr:phosphoribosylanthranilate isomerase [Thermoanaerobaculia bacterium]